jgi:hypothetical protein
MGVRNKERRAAKARAKTKWRRHQRDSEPTTRGGRPDCHDTGGQADASERRRFAIDAIGAAIVDAAREHGFDAAASVGEHAEALVATFGDEPTMLDAAVRSVVEPAVTAVWSGGWLPEDVWQVAKRRRSPATADFLVDAIAAEHGRYPAARLHPRWADQLREIDAAVWWDTSKTRLAQFAARHHCGLTDALSAAIEALSLLMTLPKLAPILPLPGTARASSMAGRRSADPKILARVRGLLAKAESTEFGEEAEALSAKAQELMSRYALERALVNADAGETEPVTARRMWLDAPYVDAKSVLVNAVASANRCRAVFSKQLGFVTVLGDDIDLDTVETLTTSLLVQATGAMLAGGRQTTRYGQSRTRSYRQSFLVAYATRIGERLQAATAEAVAETEASAAGSPTDDGGGTSASSRLLPVLAARERAVDALCDELFPRLVSKTTSVSNAAGYHAGRAAADLAVLDAGRPLEARRSA